MGLIFRDYKIQSRDVDWGCNVDLNANLSIEQIQLGAILRIADAVEKMAESQDEFKNRYEEEKALRQKLAGTVIALRGVITKLKKGLK